MGEMTAQGLRRLYLDYIDCLNQRDWAALGSFVHAAAEHNGTSIGLSGYREMLKSDVAAIPDLFFDVRMLLCDAPFIASRIHFDCAPVGLLFGLPVNGRRVRFDENVFYEIEAGRIRRVWSVIDKDAVRQQTE